MVKCLAKGHRCYDRGPTPHIADQKDQTSSPKLVSAQQRFAIQGGGGGVSVQRMDLTTNLIDGGSSLPLMKLKLILLAVLGSIQLLNEEHQGIMLDAKNPHWVHT